MYIKAEKAMIFTLYNSSLVYLHAHGENSGEVSVDTFEDDGYIVSYSVWVDVHSGEIHSFQFTQ